MPASDVHSSREATLKTRLRVTMADAVCALGGPRVVRALSGARLAVLCYHRVLPEQQLGEIGYPLPGLVVTREMFARHVAYCADRYLCLPLREALDRWQRGERSRRAIVSFTFDDGYWDNFAFARPVLEAHNVRATFFVVTGLIGSDVPTWHDRLVRSLHCIRSSAAAATEALSKRNGAASTWLLTHGLDAVAAPISRLVGEVKQLSHHDRLSVVDRAGEIARSLGGMPTGQDRIMNQQEITQLAAAGHELGGHTRSHPILTQIEGDALIDEVGQSRDELRAIIDGSVDSFAYPNGDHNEAVVAAVRDAGYRQAVTTLPGLIRPGADPLTLRRVYVDQDRLSRPDNRPSDSLFELELSGLADRLFLRRYRG